MTNEIYCWRIESAYNTYVLSVLGINLDEARKNALEIIKSDETFKQFKIDELLIHCVECHIPKKSNFGMIVVI